jgi:hypothetical protein
MDISRISDTNTANNSISNDVDKIFKMNDNMSKIIIAELIYDKQQCNAFMGAIFKKIYGNFPYNRGTQERWHSC